MAFVKLVPETASEEFDLESELEIEPQSCYVTTADIEFEVDVEQELEVLQEPGLQVSLE